MVTRTFETTKINALCVNIAEQKTEQKEFILPKTYKDEKAMMKALSAVIADKNIKAVSVISSEIIETLYGMEESDFIANAKVLPARKNKANEA